MLQITHEHIEKLHSLSLVFWIFYMFFIWFRNLYFLWKAKLLCLTIQLLKLGKYLHQR